MLAYPVVVRMWSASSPRSGRTVRSSDGQFYGNVIRTVA